MADINASTEIIGMSKEAYQLADTAMKIGIPIFFALITSLVTWFFTFKSTKRTHEYELKKLIKSYEHELQKLEKNHEKEVNKVKLQIKIKMLEDAIEIFEEYFRICSMIDALILNNIDQIMDKNIKEDSDYISVITQHKKVLNDTVKAVAKFHLLGFNKTENKFSSFSELMVDEVNKFHCIADQFMNSKEYISFKQEYIKRKEEYYSAIYEDFDKLK